MKVWPATYMVFLLITIDNSRWGAWLNEIGSMRMAEDSSGEESGILIMLFKARRTQNV